MSDNFHGVGVNELGEQIEQDQIKAKTDLITITSSINLDSLANQLSGASSSGLKTSIEGNDTDISNINDKLDMTTSSNMKTAIDLNTAKVTFPGIGTTGTTCLAGNTTTITTSQATKITANENAITAIENKTDFLTISEAVDLDNYDTINDMLQKIGNDTVLKTGAGNKIQFYQGGSQLFNSNEVKNLTDNVLISSGVNINTLDTDITGIKNNSLASTLKTAVDANTAKNSYPSADATKVSHITSDATTFKHNKLLVGEQSPSQLIIQHGDINSGNLSTTDYSMRVTNNGELRLNVPTGQDYEFRINNVMQYNNTQIKNLVDNISVSQAVDLDTMESNITTNNAKNSYPSADATKVGHISVTGAVNLDTITNNISADDLSVQTCNLRPLSIYCYGKRVHSTTDTDQSISLSTAGVALVYQNILSNGIVYNSSTGVWTVPTTGLYEVIATVNINCGAGAESVLSLRLQEGTTNIFKARSHVSRAESNNNTAMQLNMNGIVRLESSTNYNFVCGSNNSGTGTIQNDLAGNNCLIIKGAVLENSTTVPSDWNS